ncbi:MAG: acetyl-CoA C-acetyltransferase [Myxococcales bacterium]|nr:acetyl-CoA C-acetyltransferase [Myxococcales bacterium]
MSPGKQLVIIGAKRTPFGSFGGSLKDFSANDLGAAAAKAALAHANIGGDKVDQVIFGNVLQTSRDAIYHARHVGLAAGVPIQVPALTVNRLCGSGFQAIISAAEQILLGEAEVVLAGGAESMSQAPHVIRGARWGLPLGAAPMSDALWESLTDTYCNMPMAITAENLAVQHDITRAAADEFALRSQQSYAAAAEKGIFAAEISPITITSKKGTTEVTQDECPRPGTTLAALAKLAPVFKKDGVVTAGNASAITDGAAALVITTAEKAAALGAKPLARLVGWAAVGVDPQIMGIGPVPAIQKAFTKTGLSLEDMDLVEVNEAFAPQYLAVERSLGLNREKTNVNGGAIAVGHPLGASGARILTHLVYELERRAGRYGVGSACIGGGQGIAVIVERVG